MTAAACGDEGATPLPNTGFSGAGGLQTPVAGAGVAVVQPPGAGTTGLPQPTAGSGTSGAPSITAGTGGGTAGGPAPSAGTVPCAVSKALVKNCQSCHGAQLIGGAPMSLITFADFHKQAVTKPTMQVHELSLMRVNSTAMPMPPGGGMIENEKKALVDWLSTGAKAAPATEASCDTGVVAPTKDWGAGLTPRPGETCYDLPVHAAQTPGDTSPYSVKTGEHYEEFMFKVPWSANTVATRFGAKFDNVAVLHHWLLFSSAKAASLDGTHETTSGSQLGDSAELIGGWAVGGDDVEFPPDVGLELPATGMLNVQWHFYNQSSAPAMDSSVVQVCTVPKAMRQKVASITWLGTEFFNGPLGMPAHTKSTFAGTCTNTKTAPITIWSFWPHMHKLGRHMNSVVKRAGTGVTETVFDKPFDFNKQIHYPMSPEVVLAPGDAITSTCTFDNITDKSVAFGPSTEQEMCYQFAFAYPARALNNGVLSLIGASNTCW